MKPCLLFVSLVKIAVIDFANLILPSIQLSIEIFRAFLMQLAFYILICTSLYYLRTIEFTAYYFGGGKA